MASPTHTVRHVLERARRQRYHPPTPLATERQLEDYWKARRARSSPV